ncbi:MAG: hypothetical protein SFV15_00905 [Polyangiaceae bacterium]|nr:hypothetical protein [Polyangiaceae bacterium]
MQSRKAVGPALSELDLTPQQSDRFAYQNRFVPFVIRDANGNPVTSVVAQAMRQLPKAARLEVAEKQQKSASLVKAHKPTKRPKPTKPPKHPKGPRASVGPSGNTGTGAGMGSGVNRPADDLELAERVSDFGIILLERTRVTPSGFALGEHLLSLSLAPGEEVTIEQKTFSEKTVTFEEVNETDEEVNTELGSNLTTELSEALSRVASDTKNRGINVGGTLGFSYYVSLNVSAGYTDSVANALSTTQGETVRNVMTRTEKLASRRRAQHKVTMKVSETSRFEAGNKRVLRNPNQFTPVDLIYFKLLQKIKVSHERFGIRLCWAPFIPDPGVVLDQAERAERTRLEAELPLKLPVLRDKPTDRGVGADIAVSSGSVELTNWLQPWGDMRADYEYRFPVPAAGYKWDGDTAGIALGVSWSGFGARGAPGVRVLLAEPYIDTANSTSGVRVIVHAGVDWGGVGAHLYCNVTVNFSADATGASASYQAELAVWQAEKDTWDREVARLTAEREATIKTRLAEWKVAYLKTFDPVSTAFQLLIAMLFPPDQRDEGFEIEMWNKVFDFEGVAFQYYPSWWSNKERRNPEKAPDAFENASWMRVFLPIRPGFERQALNLLIERRIHTNVQDPVKKSAIEKVLNELAGARQQFFGGVDEIQVVPGTPCPSATRPYVCLAHWNELLPTDGTHLEVVQAVTTAIDDTSAQSISDAHQLMTARIGSQTSEGELTASVKDSVSSSATAPSVDVHIGIGTKREE